MALSGAQKLRAHARRQELARQQWRAAQHEASEAQNSTGMQDDWSDAARFVSLEMPFRPDPDRRRVYDEAYATWRELGSAVTPVSHALARQNR